MAVIKIKRLRKPSEDEEGSKPKKIRIKTKPIQESSKKTKLKINLKKNKNANEVTPASGSSNDGGGNGMKLKLNLKKTDDTTKNVYKTPRIRLKPMRFPGEGYDSEASDVEDDPLIEEGVILRVLPHAQSEFIKNSIESGDYSGVKIKWKGARHAIVYINSVPFGAILVDLPTIVEVNKSVDRKNLMKTIDLSQMLLCIKEINEEEEVFKLQPPDTEDLISKYYENYQEEIDFYKKSFIMGYNGGPLTEAESNHIDEIVKKKYDYIHGLTAPLYNARNRRFRRKMSAREFDYAEKVVSTLLEQDDKAEEVVFELVDESEVLKKSTSTTNIKNATGTKEPVNNEPYLTFALDDEEKDDDELDLDEAFQSEEDEEEATNVKEGHDKESSEIPQGSTNRSDTKSNENRLDETGDDVEQFNDDDDDDDDDEDDDEFDDDDDDDIEDGKREVDASVKHNELLKDELKELETILSQTQQKLEKATNPLLKSRFIDSMKKLEKELDLKRQQLKISEDSLNPDKNEEGNEEDNEEDDEDEDEDEEEDDEEDEEEEEEEGVQPQELGPGQDADQEVESDNPASIERPGTAESNDNRVEENEGLDQNDLDMMMLFGGEGDDADE